MSEYILREPAIFAVNIAAGKFPYAKDPKRPETYSKYNEGWTDACDYILGMIETEKCADVALVTHGQWMPPVVGKYGCLCSACKKQTDNRFAYCPNCGAKMDLKP